VWDISARIIGDRLQLSWDYSTNLHRETSIRTLADRFAVEVSELTQSCWSPNPDLVDPQDFPLAKLNARQLRNVLEIVGGTKQVS